MKECKMNCNTDFAIMCKCCMSCMNHKEVSPMRFET